MEQTSRIVANEFVDLAVWEMGPKKGPHLLFLHGLGGHGQSSQQVTDVTRDAFVSDVAAVCEALDLKDVLLVGQSMGAHTALLAAHAYPAKFCALVLLEGGLGGEGPRATDSTMSWFASWPVPFATRELADTFFGGGQLGAAWAAGLVQSEDGYHPQFHLQLLKQALAAVHQQARVTEWQELKCPILLVKGQNGLMPMEEYRRMLQIQSKARGVEIPTVGHDIHLETPELCAAYIQAFSEEYPTSRF